MIMFSFVYSRNFCQFIILRIVPALALALNLTQRVGALGIRIWVNYSQVQLCLSLRL